MGLKPVSVFRHDPMRSPCFTRIPATACPPLRAAGEGGVGDTGSAVSNKIDNYVISYEGLAVAPASGPITPPKKGWNPWVVKGNGPDDWLKKLKAKCGSK